MSRPIKAPKDKQREYVTFTMTRDEKRTLIGFARANRLSVSAAIRKATLETIEASK